MTLYFDSAKASPYCPGCGHPHILAALDEALKTVGLDPTGVSLVTDIGCVGLADELFPTVHTVHTLHGRSVAIAAGLYLGDRAEPKKAPVKPIVLIGDGGAGIGLLHLVHAAQMNANLTVLVHNNLVYGMTGGQHSILTLQGMKTTTTPDGSPIPPLDLGAVLVSAGAGFYARTLVPSHEVAPILAEAIRHRGFSCVEVHELCPPFATKLGGLTVADLKALPERTGRPFGIIKKDASRGTFFDAYGVSASADTFEVPSGKAIVPQPSWRKLSRQAQVVVAGKAGEHVQSAAMVAGAAAAAAGLYVTLRSDIPVTQGSGFSIAELTIAPEPIAYMGLRNPDLVLLVAREGQQELEAGGLFREPGRIKSLVIDSTLAAPNGLQVEKRDFRTRFGPKNAALGGLIEEVGRRDWWYAQAWHAAFSRLGDKPRQNAEALYDKIHKKENAK